MENCLGGLVTNLSDCRGRTCGVCHKRGFKSHSQLDSYMRNIVDLPYQLGFNNSLDGGDCLHGGHYVDDLAAN